MTASYGYLKNPKDKHKFIIDKEASYNVKKIFNMILLGKSRKEIAEHLNDRNILTPSVYKLNKEKISNDELVLSKKWNAEIVNRILRNETYTGTLIQNIKTKPSYRSDKIVDVSKDEWIITENHHEPIISKENFNEVKKVLDKKLGYFKNVDLLSRNLKCADCGKSLTIKKSKGHEYYYCSSYVRNGSCTNHSIKRDKLTEEVIKALNNKYTDENIINLNKKAIDKYINKITIDEDKKIDIEFKD